MGVRMGVLPTETPQGKARSPSENKPPAETLSFVDSPGTPLFHTETPLGGGTGRLQRGSHHNKRLPTKLSLSPQARDSIPSPKGSREVTRWVTFLPLL